MTLKAGPYKAQEWGRDVRGGPPWRTKEESHELGVMCRYMSLRVKICSYFLWILNTENQKLGNYYISLLYRVFQSNVTFFFN